MNIEEEDDAEAALLLALSPLLFAGLEPSYLRIALPVKALALPHGLPLLLGISEGHGRP
jgi:hypothetical protein